MQTNGRIPYLDTAKGLLILMLMVSHFAWVGSLYHVKTYLCLALDAGELFWTPFFMAAFFCITGMCSGFGGPPGAFILKGCKQLLLPAITLGLVSAIIGWGLNFCRPEVHALEIMLNFGWYWFLTALFVAKVLFYFIARLPARLHLAACLLLYTAGCILHITGVVDNAYSFEQGLIFMPFMYMGWWLRSHPQILSKTTFCLLLYPCLFACALLTGYNLPGVWSIILLSWADILPHLVSTASGILFVLALSKTIRRFSLLELCGRHSIFIYCLHFVFFQRAFGLFAAYVPVNSVNTALLFVVLVPCAVGACLGLAHLFSNTRLRILVGKF